MSRALLRPLLVGIPVLAAYPFGCSHSRERFEGTGHSVGSRNPKEVDLLTEGEAIAAARRFLGVQDEGSGNVTATVAILTHDDTPFLWDKVEGKMVWTVTFKPWSLDLKCSWPWARRNPYVRAVDVLLDAQSGSLIRIVTPWPDEEPDMPPPAPRESAEEDMRQCGQERYDAFASEAPNVSFLEAIGSFCQARYEDALVARQITGHCVLRSSPGYAPRLVWIVTVRGVPWRGKKPIPAPEECIYQYRDLTDAATGKWFMSTNVPVPQYRLWRAAKGN
jgi:hypothetical protein